MCSTCSCILFTYTQCITGDNSQLPSTYLDFTDLHACLCWCLGVLPYGPQCDQLLGKRNGSLCCQFHLHFIKNQKNFHQAIQSSSFECPKSPSFDKYIHHLESSAKLLPWKGNEPDYDFGRFPLVTTRPSHQPELLAYLGTHWRLPQQSWPLIESMNLSYPTSPRTSRMDSWKWSLLYSFLAGVGFAL